jgi:cysteine desulfurase
VIYLDHHAAAPTPEAVRRAMRDAAAVAWANPSSTHAAGRASRRLLERARESVAVVLGAHPADVVLTGGGTEACNLGLRAVAAGRHRIVSTAVEHPAVARSVARIERRGGEAIILAVPSGHPPSEETLAAHLDSDTAVAVQWVNHETGTIFPVAEYARACRARGARLFIDATQALGKLPVDVAALGADAVAIAAQKIGGPAGAAACWVRRNLEVEPIVDGGTQERGRRPGTPDTSSMVGFGAACDLVPARIEAQAAIESLRDRVEMELAQLGAVPNASEAPRVCGVTNLSFPEWEGPLLVAALDLEGVCVSTGAACSSGLHEPSAVIRAMYPDEQWRAGSAVRISLGIETTTAEIETTLRVFERVLSRKDRENLNPI